MAFKSVQYVQSTHAHLDVLKCCGCALSHLPAPVFKYSFPMTIVTFILWVEKKNSAYLFSRDGWHLDNTSAYVGNCEPKRKIKLIFDSKRFIVLIFYSWKIAPELKRKRKKCKHSQEKHRWKHNLIHNKYLWTSFNYTNANWYRSSIEWFYFIKTNRNDE